MIIEIRKVISVPLIKKTVEDICREREISPTQYAYELICADVHKRIDNDRLCSDLANDKLTAQTFLKEVVRVVEKYEKSLTRR